MMSTETIQSGRRKTAKQLIAEYKELLSKGARVYVPAICDAFKEENPNWTNAQIKETVIKELDGYVSASTIKNFWSDSVVSAKVLETRQRKILDSRISEGMEIFEIAMRKMDESQEKQEEDEYIDEAEIDTETPPILQTEGEPEEDKTVMEYFGDITEAQFHLWKALTRNDVMPHVHDDLIVEHIKPSRRFRKRIINKLESTERAGLSRRCGYLVAILQDTIEVIEEADKK